jgi:Fe/S biogenesis protein NfuA
VWYATAKEGRGGSTMTTHASDAGANTPILTFTDAARGRVQRFLANQNREGAALRVAIQGRSSAGFRYAMGIVDGASIEPDDVTFDAGGITVVVDGRNVDDVRGSTIDFVETAGGGGLQIDNPNPVWRDETSLEVQKVLDEQINPAVASHGGFVELLEVKDDTAYVQLGGGCQGCGMADVTLKQGIEALIREAIPRIRRVLDATDHASGTNPYYRPAKA